MVMPRSVDGPISIDSYFQSFNPYFLTSLVPSLPPSSFSQAQILLSVFFSPPMQNADAGRRKMGLLGAKRTTITVHRSEEILPPWRPGGLGAAAAATDGLARTGTSVSSGEGGDGDLSGEGSER